MTLRTAQPKRSAGGARLDGFLAESKGLSGDPGLKHFANNYQVSSAQSGSGQPPDRAQICSFDEAVSRFFFEQLSGPPNVNFQRGNAKMNVRKSASTRHVASN